MTSPSIQVQRALSGTGTIKQLFIKAGSQVIIGGVQFSVDTVRPSKMILRPIQSNVVLVDGDRVKRATAPATNEQPSENADSAPAPQPEPIDQPS